VWSLIDRQLFRKDRRCVPETALRGGHHDLCGSLGPHLRSRCWLTGCKEIKRGPSGALSLTAIPGETGTCAIASCEIFLEMPPGKGEYRVTVNEIDFDR